MSITNVPLAEDSDDQNFALISRGVKPRVNHVWVFNGIGSHIWKKEKE